MAGDSQVALPAEIADIENEHGWTLRQCAEDEEHVKLNQALSSVVNGLDQGAEITDEKKQKLAEELTRWEFETAEQLKVFRELGINGENTANIILEATRKFEKGGKKKISELVNVEEYVPRENEESLDDEQKEKLEKFAFDDSRFEWSDRQETEFVTFTQDIELENRTIHRGDTFEIPADFAEKIENEERKGVPLAGRWVWECPECNCKEIRVTEENKKITCPSPIHTKQPPKMKALHPRARSEVADHLLKDYNFLTIRETTKSRDPMIYVFDGKRYKPDANGFIRQKAKQLRPDCSPSFRSNVVKDVADDSAIPKKRFRTPDNIVVVENGILDLETLEKRNHSPDLYATSRMGAPYVEGEDCPRWEKLVKKLIPNETDRLRFQEVLGTGLANQKNHKKAVVLVGPTDSGKSTAALIIRKVFGSRENVANKSLKSLADSRFARIKLLNVEMNIVTEMSSGRIHRLDRLKNIIGGEPIDGEEKNSPSITFKPAAGHFYCANQTPVIDKQAEAFWNRFFVIETRDSIPIDEQKPGLAEEIFEEEAAGILNWLIEGYKRYVENGMRFSGTKGRDDLWVEMRDRWLGWGDSIQRFIQKYLEPDEKGKISSSELYEIYLKYCKATPRLEPLSQQKLTKRIKRYVPYAEHSRDYRFDGTKKAGFRGLKVNVAQTTGDSSTHFIFSKEKKKEKNIKETETPPAISTTGSSKDGFLSKSKEENATLRVTEKFVYEGTTFQEGEEILSGNDVPQSIAEEAIKRGYAEKTGSSATTHGSDPSQEERVRRLYEIVRELQDEHKLGALLSAVKSEAEAEAISPDFVDEFVQREKEKGRIQTHKDNSELYVEVLL